jgi:PAS domain S-box-containing protein
LTEPTDKAGVIDAELEQLRRDRERFVAFAFCSADILLELNSAQQVNFASGAIEPLTGLTEGELVGRNLLDLVEASERRVLHEMLRCVADGHRLHPKLIRFAGTNGPSLPLSMTGYYLPDLGGRYFLSLRMGPPITPRELPEGARRDAESGLFDAKTFQTAAGEPIKGTGRDAGYQLTLLELGDFSELRERLDAETRDEVIKTLGAHLRVQSLGGDLAGRIDEDRFGLIHGKDVERSEIQARIEEIAREADPSGAGVVVRAAGIDLDVQGMSETDAVHALAYTIGKYAENRDQPLTVQNLSDALKTMVEETGRQIEEIKTKARSGDFEVVFQPIVELASREPRHVEALARLDGGASPAAIIRFAEDVAVVAEFDLAMCRKMIEQIEAETGPTAGPAIAVNISNHSATDNGFARSLHRLLDEHPRIANRLIFEITDSAAIADLAAANKFIQSLRSRKIPVCLDDFGSCASALQTLQELQVDMVKIDGRHLEKALATPSGAALLRALAHLCDELDVVPIAYRVESESGATQIQNCGIRYAQGYLFGPPSESPDGPDGPKPTPPDEMGWSAPAVGALALKSRRR